MAFTILSSTDSELTVNLTWSNSRCVVVYYVEVTAATYTTSITNTTSQYIVLPLQIGVVYSFRVRGADSINRLGEWSDYFVYDSGELLYRIVSYLQCRFEMSNDKQRSLCSQHNTLNTYNSSATITITLNIKYSSPNVNMLA